MKVSLEFPDTASLTQFDHDYLKKVLVATLYHLGQLSEYEACVACPAAGLDGCAQDERADGGTPS